MSKSVKRETKVYTPEFRIQAVKLVLEQGGTIAQTAENLGVPFATLNNWVNKVKRGKWNLDPNNVKAVKATADSQPVAAKSPNLSQKHYDQLGAGQKKIAELERQVRRLTMEREILKKAMAYCLDVPK